MGFSRRFPRDVKGSPFPQWIDVSLNDVEETEQELLARKENILLLKECLEDSQAIMKEKSLKPYQTDLVNLAIALYDKRASHAAYWKEERVKEKFESLLKESVQK